MPHTSSTILIVDDEEFGREVMGAMLKSQGYQLLFAANGKQALQKARERLPDLVLLDVMMPGMDGFTVCEQLRADPRTVAMPIVMVTALNDRTSRLRGIEAGADDFLCKPVDRDELRTRVRTITRLNRYRLLLDERRKSEAQARQVAQELALAYDATIEGWARALDLRDRETEGHSERVTVVTTLLAQAMGIPQDDLPHLRRGALLHDIGKLGIPDAILLKPGPLTEEEWVIMRKHPVYAYQWLSAISFLQPALDIPYAHHERWDGRGYPRGLRGRHIPLAARLFSVVDVWDALRSNRPYRAAWSTERVRAYLEEQAGKQFDPEVVKVFLSLDVCSVDIGDIRRTFSPLALSALSP